MVHMGVSKRGARRKTPSSRALVIRTSTKGTPNFKKQPYLNDGQSDI